MKLIRNDTFETNSSSTHTLVMSLPKPDIPKRVTLTIDSFTDHAMKTYLNSWEFMLSYLLTYLLSEDNILRVFQMLNLLADNDITFDFDIMTDTPYVDIEGVDDILAENLNKAVMNYENLRQFVMDYRIEMVAR